GSLVYIGLIVILRISGKRTLTQMNAFDFIVTVALGSMVATAALSNDTPLVNGLAGLSVLILMQFLVSWLYVRFKTVSRFVKSEPRLLYYKGEFKQAAMREMRIEKEELLQAARHNGFLSFEQVAAIVMETNGKLSIIKPADVKEESCLENVERS
ncbi:MAG TPA: YetF domain-containing protein, partial [Adhaeribacter sp.]|nr:YetF domain-containing protein [Adhaeribacter sp.]